MSKRIPLTIFLAICMLASAGCVAKTPTPIPPTATLPPPTETPLPPTDTPTPLPPTATPIPPTVTATPAPPAIVGAYYLDLSTKTQSKYYFLHFFEDGTVTNAQIELDPGQVDTVINIYNRYAANIPSGKAGTYVLAGRVFELTFPSDSFKYGTGGQFVDGKLIFIDETKQVEFLPLPEPLSGDYFADRSTADARIYDYLRFFPDGTISAVTITNPSLPGDVFEIYYRSARGFLVPNPPVPASGGTYILQNGKISIRWATTTPAENAEGTYLPEQITLKANNGETWLYQPVPPLLEGLFYRDISSTGQTGYSYLQFHPDLSVSFVEIRLDAGKTATARQVYEESAQALLATNPPAPAAAGVYSIDGKDIVIIFPGGYPANELIGTYSPSKVSVNGAESKTWEFFPLP